MVNTINHELPARDLMLYENLIGKISQLFLSKEKIAKILDVSPRTVGAWRYTYSDFPARKIGKHVRYSLPEVLKWLEKTFGS